MASDLSVRDRRILAALKSGDYTAVLFGEGRLSLATKFDPVPQVPVDVLDVVGRLVRHGHLPPDILERALTEATLSGELNRALYCDYLITFLDSEDGVLQLDVASAYQRVRSLKSRYPVVEMLHRRVAEGLTRAERSVPKARQRTPKTDGPAAPTKAASTSAPPLAPRDLDCALLCLCFGAGSAGILKRQLSATARQLGVGGGLFEARLSALRDQGAVRTTRWRAMLGDHGLWVLAQMDAEAMEQRLARVGVERRLLSRIFGKWQEDCGEEWSFS